MFTTFEGVNGQYTLGQDPLHYMTIAALACDGTFTKSYLQQNTAKKRLSHVQYSIDELYDGTKITFSFNMPKNNGERKIELCKDDGTFYCKKMDGYRV